jgi:hypothetical protein
MERTQTPAATRTELRDRVGRELGGGEPTGLCPHQGTSGAVSITHTWVTVSATVR